MEAALSLLGIFFNLGSPVMSPLLCFVATRCSMPVRRRNEIINEIKVQMSQRETGTKTEGRKRHKRTSSGDHMWLLSCPPIPPPH